MHHLMHLTGGCNLLHQSPNYKYPSIIKTTQNSKLLGFSILIMSKLQIDSGPRERETGPQYLVLPIKNILRLAESHCEACKNTVWFVQYPEVYFPQLKRHHST